MAMIRLEGSLSRRDQISAVVAANSDVILLAGAAPPLMLASLSGGVAPRGLWLVVDGDYPAPLAARDVATVSWLTNLEHVVIEGENAAAQAAVVAALLTNDEVNFANEVVTLRGAYNRPAPPRPITLWHATPETIIAGETRLALTARRSSAAGELSDYA
jgi:NADPH-dependent 2,4-dienoyl-CoA reductase/sulfur reductase-like enzyme